MQSPFHEISFHSHPPVIPVVPERGMIPPEIDRLLSDRARSEYRSDPAGRNLLFDAYAPRLERILLRLWYRNLHTFDVELNDLRQELFVIFATLLERWSGNGSFSAYLHGAVPWRLYDAARYLAPSRRPLDDHATIPLRENDTWSAIETCCLLEEIAQTLSPFDRELLLRHIRDGERLSTIAKTHGLNHRTVRRAWLRVQQHLREQLTDR